MSHGRSCTVLQCCKEKRGKKLQDLRTRESNEKWPFVQVNRLSNANKLAFRKTYKEGTRWEVCGWPWEKVAVSGSHEAVFTTWKTLERRATTLYCLYHRSSTKITGKEVLRSVIVLSKGREKKLSPFVNGEFAYKMKERPTHTGGVCPLGKNAFPIFRSMHMHFPSSLSLSLSRPLCSSLHIRISNSKMQNFLPSFVSFKFLILEREEKLIIEEDRLLFILFILKMYHSARVYIDSDRCVNEIILFHYRRDLMSSTI